MVMPVFQGVTLQLVKLDKAVALLFRSGAELVDLGHGGCVKDATLLEQMLKASIRVVSVKSLNKAVPVYLDAACLHNGQIMALGENVHRRYRTVSEKLRHPCIDVAAR